MKAYFDLAEGSPPPMRGKGQNSTVFVESEGITPAYAGKSSGFHRFFLLSGDHPRLCGEKLVFIFNTIKAVGITPAYAGKSIWHS